MCGILRAGSAGSMRRTSPGIQPRPGVSPNSSPRVASSCMPTQMPRNGAPRCVPLRVIASITPGTRLEAAHAGREGADARQHHAVGAGDRLGIGGDARSRSAPAAATALSAFSAERRLPDP